MSADSTGAATSTVEALMFVAKAIGRSPRATFHLLENELLPARRAGGRWVASRRKLIDALTNDESAA